jgi:hypothetical protein
MCELLSVAGLSTAGRGNIERTVRVMIHEQVRSFSISNESKSYALDAEK